MVLQANIEIPSEGIKIELTNTKLFVSNVDYGLGTLCVAESNLIWKLDNGNGLCISYPRIALHAVSTDLQSFPHECLYVMLDNNILEKEAEDGNESDEDDEDQITEIRFVPENKQSLNELFQAMNECQALYPDDQSNSDENEHDNGDGFEDGEFYTEDNINDVELSEQGQQVMERLILNSRESGTHDEDQQTNGIHAAQFEDAD